MDKSGLAPYIDHTLLKPEADSGMIRKLCREAVEHGFYSVCVNCAWVALCRSELAGTAVKISAVCGFPLGATLSLIKAAEAEAAIKMGADEIDMVMAVGKFLEGAHDEVQADIRAVVQAVRAVNEQGKVKVILETGCLQDGQIGKACRLAEEAGADYVKTSTGFGPGGATVEHVRIMRSSVEPSTGVKASGGIRDFGTAMAMIEAGATRIGTSSGIAIVSGMRGNGNY